MRRWQRAVMWCVWTLMAAQVAPTASAQGGIRPDTGGELKRGQDDQLTSGLAPGEIEFYEDATLGGLFEVQAGRLAQSRAADPRVKEIARRMVADHGAIDTRLQELVARKGVNRPTKLRGRHERWLAQLGQFEGADFDKAYRDILIKSHEASVALYERAANGAADPELREFARRTLPTLRAHAEMARRLGTPER